MKAVGEINSCSVALYSSTGLMLDNTTFTFNITSLELNNTKDSSALYNSLVGVSEVDHSSACQLCYDSVVF